MSSFSSSSSSYPSSSDSPLPFLVFHFPLSPPPYIAKLSVSILFTGNYDDSLSDAIAATELQPTYLKAIVIGKV